MPRTTLAATALSLVAALAACTNSDRPQPTEPAATDQQTTSSPSPAPTSTSTRPLTYTDDYVGHRRWSSRWLIRSIRYGDHTLRPGIDVLHMDLTDDGLAMVANNGGIYFADESSVEKIGNSSIDGSFAGAPTTSRRLLPARCSRGSHQPVRTRPWSPTTPGNVESSRRYRPPAGPKRLSARSRGRRPCLLVHTRFPFLLHASSVLCRAPPDGTGRALREGVRDQSEGPRGGPTGVSARVRRGRRLRHGPRS